MRPTRNRNSTITPIRTRQIGRKVLQADRIAKALGQPVTRQNKSLRRFVPSIRPKVAAMACAIVLVVGATGFGITQHFVTQAAAAQKVVEAKKAEELKTSRIAADECRRKKVAEKADRLDQIKSYNELYDYDECNK